MKEDKCLKKYSNCFAKVHGLQYSVPVKSEVVKRKRQTLLRKKHLCLKNHGSEF